MDRLMLAVAAAVLVMKLLLSTSQSHVLATTQTNAMTQRMPIHTPLQQLLTPAQCSLHERAQSQRQAAREEGAVWWAAQAPRRY